MAVVKANGHHGVATMATEGFEVPGIVTSEGFTYLTSGGKALLKTLHT